MLRRKHSLILAQVVTDAAVAEWDQIAAGRSQHLVARFASEVEPLGADF